MFSVYKNTHFSAPTSTGQTLHYLHFEQTKLSGIECGFTPTHSQWNQLSHLSQPIHCSISSVIVRYSSPHEQKYLLAAFFCRRVCAAFCAPRLQFSQIVFKWSNQKPTSSGGRRVVFAISSMKVSGGSLPFNFSYASRKIKEGGFIGVTWDFKGRGTWKFFIGYSWTLGWVLFT